MDEEERKRLENLPMDELMEEVRKEAENNQKKREHDAFIEREYRRRILIRTSTILEKLEKIEKHLGIK